VGNAGLCSLRLRYVSGWHYCELLCGQARKTLGGWALNEAEAKRIRRAVNLLGVATLLRGVAVGLFVVGLLALASNGGLVVTIVLDLLAVGCLFAGRACEREGLRTIH